MRIGQDGSIRRDITSAYVASAARVGSWLIISALVYRASVPAFALLALLRATIGILNYTTLGLGPALIHALAAARTPPSPLTTLPLGTIESITLASTGLGGSRAAANDPLRTLFANGLAVAAIVGTIGSFVLWIYLANFYRWHVIPPPFQNQAVTLAGLLGAGTLLRLLSDAPGAVLQTEGKIALDNLLLASAEALWVVLAACMQSNDPLRRVCIAHLGSGLFLFFMRFILVDRHARLPLRFWLLVHLPVVGQLLKYGSLVAIAQLADFLFAPTDYILINRLIGPETVASYAPAVQIDSGLLLLVGALAAVLLPRSALAHAEGQADVVRRYYLRGTLASVALLSIGSILIWLASPVLFRLWLGSSLPETRAILPLVLLHTVIGGSTAVGRSILLAMGKVKAFTLSVLLTGILNVILSYCFVRYLRWGLTGIVLGTVAAAVVRGLLWMPWYVLRTLKLGRSSAQTAPHI